VIPIVLFQNQQQKMGRRTHEKRPDLVQRHLLVLGFSFLYLPIVLLVIFSFNESRLVTVWGGFSTKWYGELLKNDQLLDAAWVTLGWPPRRPSQRFSARWRPSCWSARAVSRPVLFSGMIFAPLVMPDVILGLSLLLLFVAMDTARGFWTVMLAHTTFAMCYVAVVVQSRLVGFDKSHRGGGGGSRLSAGPGPSS
jgi:putrescine transport system permease protein